jgi:hypothetical protein
VIVDTAVVAAAAAAGKNVDAAPITPGPDPDPDPDGRCAIEAARTVFVDADDAFLRRTFHARSLTLSRTGDGGSARRGEDADECECAEDRLSVRLSAAAAPPPPFASPRSRSRDES